MDTDDNLASHDTPDQQHLQHQARHRAMARTFRLSIDCIEEQRQAACYMGDEYLVRLLSLAALRLARLVPS